MEKTEIDTSLCFVDEKGEDNAVKQWRETTVTCQKRNTVFV